MRQKAGDKTKERVCLLLHPIVGALEEEARLFRMLSGTRVAAVLYDQPAAEPETASDEPAALYPDLYAGRTAAIARKLAALHGAVCIALPPAGINRLVRDPALLKTMGQPLPGYDRLLPVGVPPEELRTAEENGARRFFGGAGADGIAIDWLASPQKIFRASWNKLRAPLCGQVPHRMDYRDLTELTGNRPRGLICLQHRGRDIRFRFDNTGRQAATAASVLLYSRGEGGIPVVLKSARGLGLDHQDHRGPEYMEKLIRLNALEQVLSATGLPNALPVYLVGYGSRTVSGFLMRDLSRRSGVEDLKRLSWAARDGGFPEVTALKILETMCRAIAFYNRLGLYLSDIKISNFLLLRNRIVPIDCDGFSCLGSAAFPPVPDYRNPARAEQYTRLPYYHTAREENFALGTLLLQYLTGRTAAPGHQIPGVLSPGLWDAFRRLDSGNPPDAQEFADLLRQYRLGIDGGQAPDARTAHRVPIRPLPEWLFPVNSDLVRPSPAPILPVRIFT